MYGFHTTSIVVLDDIIPLSNLTILHTLGAFLYYYRPGVAVDRRGGGVIIPLPPSVGQYEYLTLAVAISLQRGRGAAPSPLFLANICTILAILWKC